MLSRLNCVSTFCVSIIALVVLTLATGLLALGLLKTTGIFDYFYEVVVVEDHIKTQLGYDVLSLLTDDNNETSNLIEQLPDYFDWRSVDGNSFMPPVRDQKQFDCGSCYVFATLTAIEAQYRVKSNNKLQPIFSPMDVLECLDSEEDACRGGVHVDVLDLGMDRGFVSDVCRPYNLPPRNCTIQPPSCKKYHPIGYIWYAKVDRELTVLQSKFDSTMSMFGNETIETNIPTNVTIEDVMRLLIYHHGPIVSTGIRIYADFMYPPDNDIYQHKPDDEFNLYQYNHLMVIIGWGIDPVTGMKYWILQNSYGKKIHENGFLKIERGVNMIDIERSFTAILIDVQM